jgi:hypothetical protein
MRDKEARQSIVDLENDLYAQLKRIRRQLFEVKNPPKFTGEVECSNKKCLVVDTVVANGCVQEFVRKYHLKNVATGDNYYDVPEGQIRKWADLHDLPNQLTKQMKEAEILDSVTAMCEESLSPGTFELWETVKAQLLKNRNKK